MFGRDKLFILTEQNEENVYLANTSCAANLATFIQATDSKSDRRMDRYYSEKSLGVMWSSSPHLDLVNRAACQNDHTWCPFFFVSVSLLSLSTPFCESPLAPCAHTLTGTHTLKRGRAKAQTRKLSTVHSSRHLLLPVCSNFSLSFPKVSCFPLFPLPSPLTKTWFIRLHAFTYRMRAVGGRYREHLGPAYRTFLPPGFSTSEHRPSLCFDVQ